MQDPEANLRGGKPAHITAITRMPATPRAEYGSSIRFRKLETEVILAGISETRASQPRHRAIEAEIGGSIEKKDMIEKKEREVLGR